MRRWIWVQIHVECLLRNRMVRNLKLWTASQSLFNLGLVWKIVAALAKYR